MINGEYVFKAENLYKAHEACFDKFCNALNAEIKTVIVANTNVDNKSVNKYIDKARELKYTVFSLVVENRNDTKDVHSVPEKTLELQETRLRQSLKLR